MRNDKLYTEKRFRKGTLSLVLDTIKHVKWDLILGIVLSLVATFLSLYSPLVLQKLIDKEISPKFGIINKRSFAITTAIYLGSILLANIFRFLKQYQLKRTSNKAGHVLRKELYEHTINLPLSYFDQTPVGKIASRVVGDVDEIKNLFFMGFDGMFSSFCYIAGSIVYVATQNTTAALILCIPIPILTLLVFVYNKFSAKYNIEYRKNTSKVIADLNEHLNGSEVIRAYGVMDPVNEEYAKINERSYNIGKKMELFDAFFSFNISSFLSMISNILILALTGYSIINQKNIVTVGFALVLINYNNQIYENINNTLRRMNVLEKALASSHHITELFDVPEEIDGERKIRNMVGDVEIKDLSFSYIGENYVLNDIVLNAKHGTKTAIVGDTGSGKSSIINLLFRFYVPQKGEITIDGYNLNDLKKDSFRKEMALVLQDPFIFKDNLRNNITLGDKYSDKEIIDALFKVGGQNLYSKMKDGLDTDIMGEGTGLSLGEKQIVTFARTILRDPKILVLDEATASIDTETEKYIQMGLDELMKGRTSFIIAHRLSTIKNCDQIIVMEKGRIVERGNHEELIGNAGKYYELATKAN